MWGVFIIKLKTFFLADRQSSILYFRSLMDWSLSVYLAVYLATLALPLLFCQGIFLQKFKNFCIFWEFRKACLPILLTP